MIEITSNYHQRALVSWLDLSIDDKAEFDYILSDEFVPGVETNVWPDECHSLRFFKYRDSWYDVNQFQRISLVTSTSHNSFALTVEEDSPLASWNASQTDSVWSGILIRWGTEWDGTPSFESVVVGSAYWG